MFGELADMLWGKTPSSLIMSSFQRILPLPLPSLAPSTSAQTSSQRLLT